MADLSTAPVAGEPPTHTPPGFGEHPSASPLASDLARRVRHRRTELGLSVEELAKRAGIDPGYLRYFEMSPQATLSAGTLQLMALALDTTPLVL